NSPGRPRPFTSGELARSDRAKAGEAGLQDEDAGAPDLEPAHRGEEKVRALARVRDLEVHADDDAARPEHRAAPRRAVHGAHLVAEVAATGRGRDGDAAE